MAMPFLLIIHHDDPWYRKFEKKLARLLWNDLQKYRYRLPTPAEGYPVPEEDKSDRRI